MLFVVFILSSFDLAATENDGQNVILINSPDCPVQLLNASIKVETLKAKTGTWVDALELRDVASRPKISRTSLYIENTIDSKDPVNIE